MTIYLAGNLISSISFTGFGHLQLVKDGNEIEVQAPQPWNTLGYWQFPGEQTHSVPAGSTIGDPATYSDSALVLDDGISEEGVWSIFLQASENLSTYTLPYDTFFNSNSFANTLLKLIGSSVQEFVTYPTTVSAYPGMNADAAQMGWGIEWDIIGSDGNDQLNGGWESDKFQGGTGIDVLKGGAGDDVLYGGDETSPVDGVADYLYGGQGKDKFYVGNTFGPGLFEWDFDIKDYKFNESLRGTYDVIMDYSPLDKAYVTIDGYWSPFDNVEMSGYTLTDSGYTMGGKVLYGVDGFSLNAIRDTYFDENLGYNISVVIFYEPEIKTPIFAIRESGGTGLRTISSGSSGDDVLIGTDLTDTIFGGDGNDELSGEAGDDELYGDSGDDVFYAHEGDGADLYDGGAGRDHVVIATIKHMSISLQNGSINATGEDTDSFDSVEAFTTGAGNDTFIDADVGRHYDAGTGNDTVAFEFDASHYRILASGSGYLVERAYVDRDAGLDERYLFLKGFENVTFNGVAANFSDILTVATAGTTAAETLTGTNRNETIFGGGGDDILYGGLGSDILDGGEGDNQLRYDGASSDYTFKQNSDGSVSIVSNIYGYDVALNFATIYFVGENATYDIAALLAGPGTIVGTSGNDTLTGTTGDDVFIGGLGDDHFNSGPGSDKYRYAVGDGNDYIDDESGSTTDIDVLEFTGLDYADVTFSQDSVNTTFVTVTSTGHVITLDEQTYAANEGWGLERIEFADGVSIDLTHSRDEAWTYNGTTGNDSITGAIWGQKDIFIGGKGDDYLNGEAGSDTYVYASGDGSDIIDDEVGFADQWNVDVLLFNDLNASDVSLSRDGADLKILVTATGDVITVDDQFYSTTDHWGIEEIKFADDSIIDRTDILAFA